MDTVNVDGNEYIVGKSGSVKHGIKWEDGAVCFAGGIQWFYESDYPTLSSAIGNPASYESLVECDDFQLNEIRQGDYIEASELDTEQKYNDTVEVLELLGFHFLVNYEAMKSYGNLYICENLEVHACSNDHVEITRKITYSQLMAIGKLKRAMVERDEKRFDEFEKLISGESMVKIDLDNVDNETVCGKPKDDFVKAIDRVNELESNWSDEHYNHFYQLTKGDIKAGKIKVDAYFVNRMWKINSWEDTGAGFHILKTFPRIANNKNSLKRELVALKKQVDILCKLHGVDNDTN